MGSLRPLLHRKQSILVILAGSSAIVSPLLLKALLPWVAGGAAARMDLAGMVSALLTIHGRREHH
jgi:hypothetical protein